MKALILSCNTGGGHNSAARAIAEEMQERGDEAYVLDYLCLAGEGVSRLVGDGYVQIVKKTPRLFGLFYKLGMVASRLLKKSPVYYINGRMAKYLDGYLREHPVDVLIMPHLYPAETITYMKRKGMKLPLTVAVMTDYTCIPFWEETDCDCNRDTRAGAFENQPCGPGLQRDSGSGRHAAEGGQGAYCPA